MSTKHVDVAILGGGKAGLLAARQLKREAPSLSVALFEKTRETSWKVGEATVEIFANYLTRRLGLSRYLYERHLPKNGLRFYFDNEAKNAPLSSMSEVGSQGLPMLPSFQLDRARLEEDLFGMNARDGVLVHRGARVSELSLGEGGAEHRFHVEGDDGPSEWSAKWVLDASGRSSLVARNKGLRVDVDHEICSVWGRFKNVTDIDDYGTPAFRARCRHTCRMLSTVHFCYDGYWIWFIPLKDGVISVGVVMRRQQFDESWRKEEGFLGFLKSHGAVEELLRHAELLDVMSYKKLAYGTTQYFSTDRWATIGEAGAFGDPFYSPGGDFIAMENDFAVDLVRRDLVAGEGPEALADRTRTYDEFMKFRFDATMLLYKDLYPLFGSFDLLMMKWDFDLGSYYNLWVEPYFADLHRDLDFLKGELRQRSFVIGTLESFAAQFRKVEAAVRARGDYHKHNLGIFKGGLDPIDYEGKLGTPDSRRMAMKRTREAFNRTNNAARMLLGAGAGSDLSMAHFITGKAFSAAAP
jgi:flavin-dependent dehydrogenase